MAGSVHDLRPRTQAETDEDGDGDVSVVCQTDAAPRIPEGTYEVGFVSAKKTDFKRRPLVYLTFQVADPGPYLGVRLVLACNLRDGRMTESCKYWQAWCLAAGTRPQRGDRMSTLVFRGLRFRARVRDVTTTWQQAPRAEHMIYSVIDCLLERTAGGTGR